MILEVAAGVLLGNTVSMGLIAGVNMHLDKKHAKKMKDRWDTIAELADTVFDQEAPKPRQTAKKKATAAANRTKVE